MRSEVVDFAAGNTDIVEAMIGKAGCLATQLIFGWSESAAEDKKQATELIDSALSKSGGNPRAHTIKGALLLLGQPVQALAEFNAALRGQASHSNEGEIFFNDAKE